MITVVTEVGADVWFSGKALLGPSPCARLLMTSLNFQQFFSCHFLLCCPTAADWPLQPRPGSHQIIYHPVKKAAMEVHPASPHYAKGTKTPHWKRVNAAGSDTLDIYKLGKTQAISGLVTANSYSHRNLKRPCHKHTSEPESWIFLFI